MNEGNYVILRQRKTERGYGTWPPRVERIGKFKELTSFNKLVTKHGEKK